MPKLPAFLLLILGFAIPKEDHNNSFHSVVLDMGSFGVHGIFQANSIELSLVDICDPKIQKKYCLNPMRQFRRFCRSPNYPCMGITFLMDANTSKDFYNFMGMEQTLMSH